MSKILRFSFFQILDQNCGSREARLPPLGALGREGRSSSSWWLTGDWVIGCCQEGRVFCHEPYWQRQEARVFPDVSLTNVIAFLTAVPLPSPWPR